jgi:hypothetical protein
MKNTNNFKKITPKPFDFSSMNELSQNSFDSAGSITPSTSYLNKGNSKNNPLIGGSYNKMIGGDAGGYSGGGGSAIAGLASMFGGKIPSPLQFAAQQRAGEMGYSSVGQMQSDMNQKRQEKDMEDQKIKAYEDAIRSGQKGGFSGPWGYFEIK